MLHAPAASLNDKLRLAASKGQTSKVLELLDLGARCDEDQEGRTALHFAAHYGYSDTVAALILAGCGVDTTDFSGHSALQRAAAEGHVEVVQLLIKHGSQVDRQDDIHGNTALHEAAWKGYSHTLQVLCKAKANVYLKNKGGFAPLHLACQNGHNQSCRVLLLAGCKPDIKNNYGDTPLHTSARYGHAGVMRILISAGCAISEQNKNDDTALHISSAMGRRKLTRILLESGCNQLLRNKQGESATDIAKRKSFSEVLEILQNPVPRRISVRNQDHHQKHQKKRDKDSGTSKDSKDSGSRHKGKHKKSKHVHGHRLHKSGSKEWHGHSSPYGCHYSANLLSSFSKANLDSLPKEPLKKGEQYYLDLGGNIRKGPIGVAYACYCIPFFQHVEQKMENDKQELIEHIDLAHDDLNAKITNLERRTRTQLRNINQGMKERLAADKAECLEKVERASIREHFELERLQQHHSERLKNELRTLIQSQIRDLGRHETRNGNRQSRAESDDGVNRTGIKQEEDEDDDEVDDDESENSEEDDFNLRVTAGAGSLFVDDVRRSARHPRFRGQDHGGCRILSRSKSEEALSERGRHRASDSGGSVPSFTFSGLRQLRNRFSGREQNKENEERDFNVGTTGFNINNVPHNEWHGSSGAEGQGEGKRSSGVVSVHRVHDGNSSIVQDRLERSSFSPSGMVSGECSTTDTKTSFSTQPHSSYPCFSQHRPYSRNVTSSGSEPRRLGPSQQPSESVLLHDSLDRDSGYTTKLHSSFDSQCSTVRPSHSPNDPNVPHTLQFQQLNRHQRLRHFAEELGGDPNEPDFLAMNRQFLDTVSHETDKWYERRMLSMERQATSAVVGVGTDDPAAYYRTDVRRGQNHGVNEGPPSWNQTTDHRTVGDQLALHGTDKRQFQYPSDVRIRPSLSVSRDSRTPATVPENDLEDKHTSSLV